MKPSRIKIMEITAIFVLGLFIFASTVYAEDSETANKPEVSEGKTVFIEYTLKLEDNTVLDSNVGGKPLSFIHGQKQIIPGLEKELTGMKIDEIKHVVVKPEDGYGMFKKEAVKEISRDKLPQNNLKVGARLQGRSNDGRLVFAIVKEIKENIVVLDYNHPLAGKTLYFDVKILDIKG